MSGFSDFHFVDPGYPVVRGFIIPYRMGDELVDVSVIGEEDVKRYVGTIAKMKEFISESLNFCEEQGIQINRIERLELIGDLIVIFLRVPLIREVIPGITPTPLKIYLLNRLGMFRKEVLGGELDPMQDPSQFLKLAYGYSRRIGYLKPFNILNDKALSNDLESCWFLFPADTRPGLNISSLLSHLMLTSAIAWGLAVERGLDRESIAKLRLAAIIHDLGKPFDYRRHVTVSTLIAKELLRGIVPEADEIAEYVRRHHFEAKTTEGRILMKADSLASSIDRLTSLTNELIGKELRELASEVGFSVDEIYGAGERSWKIWAEVNEKYPGSIEQLTKLFVRRLRERLHKFTSPIRLSREIGHQRPENQGLIINLIDVGGIQNFITRFTELRCVEAASLLVDSMIMAQVPILIHKAVLSERGIHYPMEAILYAAGGIMEYLIPRKLLDCIIEQLNDFKKIIPRGYPSIRYAWTYFSPDYTDLAERLGIEMQLRKISAEKVSYEVDWSLRGTEKEVKRLCDICYDNPAKKANRCEQCDMLYDLGSQMHFRIKYEGEHEIRGKTIKPENVFGETWDSISTYIMELIAGHDWDELKEKIRGADDINWRNIAVIKVDGNLMGPFMATSLSISDAYERSIRIDLALKKAFEHSLNTIYSGVESLAGEIEAQKAILSVMFGVLYMGGDDTLILCPSWLSIALSNILGKEFNLNLGGVRGLSIGIAVSNCRANVWSLIGAAGKLVGEVKNAFRNSPELSGICFDIVEVNGSLTETSAKVRLDMLRSELVSIQPIPIGGNERSLESLLKHALVGLESNFSYEETVKRSYLLSRMKELLNDGEKTDLVQKILSEQANAKKIMSAIRECLRVANTALEKLPTSKDRALMKDMLSSIAELYAQRQLARSEGRGKNESWKYRVVLSMILLRDGEKRIPFSDIERLLKIIGGGAL